MPPAGALSSEGALSGWEEDSGDSAVGVLGSELASSDALSGWLLEESALDELPLEEDGWELAGSPAEQAATHRASSRAAAAKTIRFMDLTFLSGFWFVFLVPIIGPKEYHVKYLYSIIYHRKLTWLFPKERPGSPGRQAIESHFLRAPLSPGIGRASAQTGRWPG